MKRRMMTALAVTMLGSVLLCGASRADDVYLYSERNYRGENKRLDGDWNGRSDWGSRTRSINVPSDRKVIIYSEQDYRGRSQTLVRDWSATSNDWWAGRIRSVRVEDSFGGTGGNSGLFPTLYDGSRWNGTSQAVTGRWRDDGQWDGSPYKVHSVRVPSAWTLRVFSGDSFNGRTMLLTRDWTSTSPGDWNYDIRSAEAIRNGSGGGSGGGSSRNVRIHSGRDMSGTSKTLYGDWAGDSNWDGSPYSVRSIDNGTGKPMTIYRLPNYRGDSKVVLGDFRPAPGDYWYGDVNSIRFGEFGGSGGSGGGSGSSGSVRVFSQRSYSGASRTVTGNWPGDSSWDGSPYAINSIRVPDGLKATCYDQPNYRGSQTVITNDWNPATNAAWAGRIRSIKVTQSR